MENKTTERKSEHIRICLDKPVEFEKKTNGFEKYDFVHNALPELEWNDIDTSTVFMGKKFSMPLLVEAMTGGTHETRKINQNLARAAGEIGIGMGIGSQRAAIENPEAVSTFQVRNVAPDIFLLANLGAAQIVEYSPDKIKSAVEMINADALVIHLNTAQELFQKGGHRKWKNVLAGINSACSLGFPVIVKEVGCGISADVARRLEESGVSAIDVAGAGGTSWIKVEYYNNSSTLSKQFFEWGIPTAESLEQCSKSVSIPLIASGGIRTGMDIAKSIAMGASLAGMALPLLRPATESYEAVKEKLEEIRTGLKATMLLVGVRNIEELKKIKIKRVS